MTNLFIIYFTTYGIFNLIFLVLFFIDFMRKRWGDREVKPEPRVTIIVPAYNEEKVIKDTVDALTRLDYKNLQIIVVDDGSTDATRDVLISHYEMSLTPVDKKGNLKTAKIEGIYRSSKYENLMLIAKENGGKSDTLNAGLNFADGEIVVTIDADTILGRKSIKRLVYLLTVTDAAAMGGLLTVSNEVTFKEGIPVKADVPKNPIVLFQLIEYLVSYTIGRVALSRLNSLLVLSGAFSAYRRNLLFEVGGFLSSIQHGTYTVCEDMEIIVRLHRYLKSKGDKRKILFMPFPVAWTEVPSSLRSALKQRNRWHRGLAESLLIHRDMILEPRYGHIGLFAMPYYLIFEFLTPTMKLLSLIFIAYLAMAGLVDTLFVLLLLLVVITLSALYTALLTFIVELRFKKISRENIEALRYRSTLSWIKLVLFSFLLEPVFGIIRTIGQLWGTWDFIRGEKTWYKYERTGGYSR